MNDRALIRAGRVGAVLAAICCAAPLLAAVLPLAGLSAWLAGAGLAVLPPMVVGIGLVGFPRRHAKGEGCEKTEIHKESVRPCKAPSYPPPPGTTPPHPRPRH